ncbi:hypothetical protein QR680_005784 [Steinernema hermaphroditum]|uniref:Receptor expression-enhancing protein n=1 Tax=Steinernema hermaphroditum TaxID=289476 RepID=A0AA39LW07_9BILA|nr:hypothetical protein QR680_005784 [Steinernema hermaphroditum]
MEAKDSSLFESWKPAIPAFPQPSAPVDDEAMPTLTPPEIPLNQVASFVSSSFSSTATFLSKCFKKHEKLQSWVEYLEYVTGVSREKVSYPVLFLVLLYLVYSQFSEFLSVCCGVIYPLYATAKALKCLQMSKVNFGIFRTVNPKREHEIVEWVTYWCVFSMVSIVGFFVERVVRGFPAYWFLKAAFFLYLYRPETNGAPLIYNYWISPAVAYFDNLVRYYFYVKVE